MAFKNLVIFFLIILNAFFSSYGNSSNIKVTKRHGYNFIKGDHNKVDNTKVTQTGIKDSNIEVKDGSTFELHQQYVITNILKSSLEEDSTLIEHNNMRKIRFRSDLSIPNEHIFLDRHDIIEKIDTKFSQNNLKIYTIALIGIGGAGKTTLARQYVSSQKANVLFELNAETAMSIQSSFSDLAEALSLTTKEDHNKLNLIKEIRNIGQRERELISFVKHKLLSSQNWVLIYDNVKNFAEIQKYFPQDPNIWGTGRVIITTQNSNIRNNTRVNYVLPINDLTDLQKRDFFIKILLHNENEKLKYDTYQLENFLKLIPPFPLDVLMAACYLKTTHLPLEKYLENLKSNDTDFEQVQNLILQDIGSIYNKTRYNIITTSLKDLIKDKDFRDLLLLISLLDSQDIPRGLLDKYKSHVLVDKFLYYLKIYSFVTNEISSSLFSCFSIHRSTQDIALAYLKHTLNLGHDKILLDNIALILVSFVEDIIEEENTLLITSFYDHLKYFLSHDLILTKSIKQVVNCELGGLYAHFDYLLAEKLLNTNIQDLSNDMNSNSKVLAKCLLYQARVYLKLTRYEKSKKLFQKSLNIYQLSTPKDYLKIAQIKMYLGQINEDSGNYKQSKKLYETSLNLYKKYYPQNHMRIAWSSTYLGGLYRSMGNFDKAKNILQEALSFYNKNLLEKYYTQLTWAIALLGNVYRDLGDYNESIFLLKESVRIRDEFDDKQVCWSLVHLGNTYRKLGNYSEAISSYERSLDIYKKFLPGNEEYFAWIEAHLGNVYLDIGDYARAKYMLEKSYETYNKKFAHNNIKIAWLTMHLGHLYVALNDHNKSKVYLEKSLDIYKNTIGESYFKIGEGLLYLGSVHIKLGNYEEARSLLIKALTIRGDYYGIDHPEIARLLISLAELEYTINNNQQALSLLEQASQILQSYPDLHPDHVYKIKTNELRKKILNEKTIL